MAVGLLSALCSYVTSMLVVTVITSRSGFWTGALLFLEDQKGMLTISVLVLVGRTSLSSKFRSKCVVEREGVLHDANVEWIIFLLHI